MTELKASFKMPVDAGLRVIKKTAFQLAFAGKVMARAGAEAFRDVSLGNSVLQQRELKPVRVTQAPPRRT